MFTRSGAICLCINKGNTKGPTGIVGSIYQRRIQQLYFLQDDLTFLQFQIDPLLFWRVLLNLLLRANGVDRAVCV